MSIFNALFGHGNRHMEIIVYFFFPISMIVFLLVSKEMVIVNLEAILSTWKYDYSLGNITFNLKTYSWKQFGKVILILETREFSNPKIMIDVSKFKVMFPSQ